jgi:hypothetical protein
VAEFESGKNQVVRFAYQKNTLPIISTLLNSFLKWKQKTVAITKTLHVLLSNTSVVTLRKRGKNLMYGSPSLFSLGVQNRQVLILLFV